jgi:Glycosyltransferase Family 4
LRLFPYIETLSGLVCSIKNRFPELARTAILSMPPFASQFVLVVTVCVIVARVIVAFQSPPLDIGRKKCSHTDVSTRRSPVALHASIAVSSGHSQMEVPPLKRNPKRKICLMVEPTPFTHVSGYANRFKEMLKFLKKAGDDVDILTVDSKTPAHDLPKEYQGYSVSHTQGFTFPLYNHISLTIDLPEMKGAQMIERNKPDIIHVTSPGFLLFAAMFYARVMKIPLVMSYHTHLPTYGTFFLTLKWLYYFVFVY